MASQLDRDWEEQQLGLQGTSTGSMHNQIGLDSRMPRPDTTSSAISRGTSPDTVRTAPTPPAPSKPVDFSWPMAILGFGVACYGLHDPSQSSAGPMLLGAGVAALLAGRFYKVILGIGAVVGLAIVFNHFES